MITILQTGAFVIIALNFIVCVLAVIRPWLMEAFHKPVRREAIIIQFRPRRRNGGYHG